MTPPQKSEQKLYCCSPTGNQTEPFISPNTTSKDPRGSPALLCSMSTDTAHAQNNPGVLLRAGSSAHLQNGCTVNHSRTFTTPTASQGHGCEGLTWPTYHFLSSSPNSLYILSTKPSQQWRHMSFVNIKKKKSLRPHPRPSWVMYSKFQNSICSIFYIHWAFNPQETSYPLHCTSLWIHFTIAMLNKCKFFVLRRHPAHNIVYVVYHKYLNEWTFWSAN